MIGKKEWGLMREEDKKDLECGPKEDIGRGLRKEDKRERESIKSK